MAIWLVRAGKHGEYESKFLDEDRVYVTWQGLSSDLSKLHDRSALDETLQQIYPDAKPKTIQNWVSQIWPFRDKMAIGDLVILPRKSERTIQVGEITGGYEFNPEGPDPFFHRRSVRWVGESIPRDNFGKDLLNTFGAFMTICRVRRHNAEARIEEMRRNGWSRETNRAIVAAGSNSDSGSNEDYIDTDLEVASQDQIARMILAKFKGHGLTRLIEGILNAKGYTTYRSPEGADGGADILAGAGPLGFGSPRLCVEVKSEDSPIDRPTVDKLLGAVSKFGADEGLFVSWGGFRKNVHKELASSFFRLRLWSQAEILKALFENYEHLDEELKAELPLKRIWTVAIPEE